MSRLAVSNIAWAANEEPEVARLLQRLGITYVEIAPTKVWPDPLTVSDEEIERYKTFWAGHGITIVAFQSMLFGRPELTIFDNPAVRQQTKDYLAKYIELAGRVGAAVLVFGSPKNRQRKGLALDKAQVIAREFFADLGRNAQAHQTNFCLEPNGEAYGCDFIMTAEEGLQLVKEVNSPGFQLHLDTGCMAMSHDDMHSSIIAAKDCLRHFHISTPFLEPIDDKLVDHRLVAASLKEIGYKYAISIEMRAGDEGQNVERVRQAVELAQQYYGLL